MDQYEADAPFMEDGAAYEALDELERRHILEQTGRIAAELAIEIVEKGPFGLYLQERRTLAKDALLSLATINPNDGVAIATQQAVVKEYLRLSEWVRGWFNAAQAAEETIKREYGDATHID